MVTYSLLRKRLHWQKVHHMVHEAVEIETQFVCEALPCALIGMNSSLMSQYIKFVADRLLVHIHQCSLFIIACVIAWAVLFFPFLLSGCIRVPEEVQCGKSFWLDGIYIFAVSTNEHAVSIFVVFPPSPYIIGCLIELLQANYPHLSLLFVLKNSL